MADSSTDILDDRQSRHATSESVQEEHASTEDAPPEHLGSLLGSNALRGRANATARASAIQQAQRLHGNRAVQRLMQRQSGAGEVSVQRSPWSDLPYEPMCPIIPVGPQIGCRPLGGRDGGGRTTEKPPSPPAPSPGKKKKGEKPAKTKGKGQKGGKPGETDKDGGFTMTLEDFIKLTGHNPLDGIGGRGGILGGGFGRDGRWPY